MWLLYIILIIFLELLLIINFWSIAISIGPVHLLIPSQLVLILFY